MTRPVLLIAAQDSNVLVVCKNDHRVTMKSFAIGPKRDALLLPAIAKLVPQHRLAEVRLIVVSSRVPSFSQTRVVLTTANTLSAVIGCPVIHVPAPVGTIDVEGLIDSGIAALRKSHPRWVLPTYSAAPNISSPTRGKKVHINAGGLVFDAQRQALLLVQRKDNRRIGTPKGHREGEEKLVDTAMREIAEETGIADITMIARLPAVRYFADDHGKLPKPIPHILHHFLFLRKSSRVQPRMLTGEVKNLRLLWLPVPLVKIPPHLHPDLKPVVTLAVKILKARGFLHRARQNLTKH